MNFVATNTSVTIRFRALEDPTALDPGLDNAFVPSHHFDMLATGARLNSTMIGINIPIRIGKATVMPGDVVLGRDGGVSAQTATPRQMQAF